MEHLKFETVAVEVSGSIGRVTLNRPDKLNPLSTLTLQELTKAFAALDGHRGLKVVIVSGAGRAFSAGADVSFFGDISNGTESAAATSADSSKATAPRSPSLNPRDAADAGRLMVESLERLRAVTIAAIWGPCVGGGLVLAAGCDLRVAAADTYFSIPEVDLGIPLAWGGIPRLVREIGPAMTRELVLTCRPFTAAEAQQLGFLNRVVDQAQVMAEVEQLAEELAAKSSLTLHSTKRHVIAVLDSMTGTSRSWNDADGLVGALRDPESRQVADRYLGELSKRRA